MKKSPLDVPGKTVPDDLFKDSFSPPNDSGTKGADDLFKDGTGALLPNLRLVDESVLLTVNVPAEAAVYVNGRRTTSTGAARQFISRGLQAGYAYRYEVRAELTRDGKRVSDTKVVQLQAGQQTTLAFPLEAEPREEVATQPAPTKLSLKVPAEAKVFLAGHQTKATGEVREYTTTKLASGETWNDYSIRVVLDRDGREMTRQQTISLVGGQDRKLTFDFDAPQEVAGTESDTAAR